MTKFVDDNSDINEFVDNALKFASDYRFLLHKNAEEYEQKRIGRGRLVTCLLVIACYLVTLVRLTWFSIVHNKDSSGLIAFTFELLLTGNNENINSISKIFASYGVLQFLSGLLIWQFKEFQYKNTALEFLLNFQKQNIVPLNYRNSRKVGFIMTMMSKVFLNRPLLHTFMFLTFIYWLIASIISYYIYPGENYIWSEFIWNILLLPCIISIWSYIPFFYCVIAFELLYLRYKMKEIVDRFGLYTNFQHISHVQLISEHNTICKYIADINKFGSLVIFGLYYMIQPTYIMAMIIAESEEVEPFFKLIFFSGTLIIFTIILLVTRYVSRISELSRQPLNILFRFMSENRLTLEERLKTMTYIDRLMGPDIGFYCLDLFPIDSYEFYLFVVDCVKNYLLFKDFT